MFSRIYHFTDGADQLFKNKSIFANFLAHEKILAFPLPVWHFYAMVHGRGARDNVGDK